jgi:tripartite-type tricarboxylate transporter receptor subunit TctC
LKLTRRKVLLSAAAAIPFPALASSWPDKPVRVVVPYAAGSLGDTLARVLADAVRGTLGSMVVDNKVGAGGNIGVDAVVQAPADGYTFLFAPTNNFVINQYLYKKMRYDPLTAIEPVTIVADVPTVVFVNSQTNSRTFPEFVRNAKAKAGKWNYGSSGAGTMLHLSGELINRAYGLGLTHVAFKGSPEVMNALLSDQVQMYVVGAAVGAAHVKSGRLHAIAVSGDQRLALLPDTPTFEQAGLGNIKAGNWWAIGAPQKTPAEVVNRFHAAVREAFAQPAVQARMQELGVSPVASTPQATALRFDQEARFWKGALKDMNISVT